MTEPMKTNEEERGWQQLYGNMLFWEFDGIPSGDSVSSAVGFMEQALELTQGASVLDLGCGLGYHAIELARRGYEVTGLDWSDQYLDVARREAEEAGVAVAFLQGDMARMTFEGEFNVVILWGNTFAMLAHEDNVATLQGIHRALRHGGRALIDTQNYTGLPCRAVTLGSAT